MTFVTLTSDINEYECIEQPEAKLQFFGENVLMQLLCLPDWCLKRNKTFLHSRINFFNAPQY